MSCKGFWSPHNIYNEYKSNKMSGIQTFCYFCQFWYTTAQFGRVKSTQKKLCKLAKICLNRPKFRILYDKKCTVSKKVYHGLWRWWWLIWAMPEGQTYLWGLNSFFLANTRFPNATKYAKCFRIVQNLNLRPCPIVHESAWLCVCVLVTFTKCAE